MFHRTQRLAVLLLGSSLILAGLAATGPLEKARGD